MALYKIPSDKESFDEYYEQTHMPITKKIPNIKEIRLGKVFGSPTGKSDLYLQAEICFEDKTSFKEAMKTKEAMDSGQDLMKFAGDIVSVHFVEETVV